MSKVLITGIGGFTGRHLAAELEDGGHEVCGISHGPKAGARWPTYTCDLLDHGTLTELLARERPDAVVHLAAISFVAHGDASAIYQANVLGTRNLLNSVVASGCSPRSILLASSANVYGNSDREVIDEHVPPAPANDYAVSKLAMEYVANLWRGKLPITIVRPFNYTGIGQSPNFLLPKIVDHFRRKAPLLELGNLHVVRDFSDVRMIVRAYGRLLHGDFAGQVFNVCSGAGHALLDVLTIMKELTGFQQEIRVNPAYLRSNEVHRLVGNGGKLQRAIGTLPRISLRETLSWMLESAA
ncbi:NAD-dependent epimerase/dehydratase family protein [Paraburkholderia phenazinium]|jgi:nucleoside-diphosphate-sugar epimerase|uniref:Nucleoside-diphosphate-sugar epimerase n=1 Tax=Paraburkholderia phenazinium TaxID=60549 RepID=A0A1G8E0P1_9BURK|nr:NAD-dependent epimerase/dehydratase family protein [Paraburkholderia phenazinium]SDH63473.1 Nucleoside-diphosphate-sugar epimerase [Paraburkholderia phenazinium]